MTRVVFFLIIVGALALGVAWLADRPGDVLITWQGLRIETSLMVLVAAVLAATVTLLVLFALLRMIALSPLRFRRHLNRRRGERAYQAISRGLIAIGAGDLAAARRHMAEAKRIAPAEPLSLLLSAQHAQLAGDRDAADSALRTMASRPDTKPLGLHGLFIEARRRGDRAGAHAFAEEAARENPSLGWAGKAVLEQRCLAGDWVGALALLENNKDALDRDSYNRQRAVMLTARALGAEDTDRDNAKAFALEAVKLAPDLTPAAALAGRMLAEGGELRKASRLIHKAWEARPHPDLARVFSDLRFGDTARDRLKRIEALAKKVPDHVESALALARAALEAQDFDKARAALAPHLATLTRRVALLMAEIERAEHNDEGRAREWIARALHAAPDPAWTAEGHVSESWLPVSPSGRLDGFEWREPLNAVAPAAHTIEPTPPAAALALEQKPQVSAAAEAASQGMPPARARSIAEPPKPDAVIPLVHAPDDPGPDAPQEEEQSETRMQEPSSGWRKMFE